MGYELLTYRELDLGGYAVAIKSNGIEHHPLLLSKYAVVKTEQT